MKYGFNPQKALLVAGMAITTYAQACYYQTTQAFTCAGSGQPVDKITWVDNTTVELRADGPWTVNPTSSMVYTSTGVGGRTTVVNGGSALYCTGYASWNDWNMGQQAALWKGNSVTHNYASLPQPYYSGVSATTGGSTCQ